MRINAEKWVPRLINGNAPSIDSVHVPRRDARLPLHTFERKKDRKGKKGEEERREEKITNASPFSTLVSTWFGILVRWALRRSTRGKWTKKGERDARRDTKAAKSSTGARP